MIYHFQIAELHLFGICRLHSYVQEFKDLIYISYAFCFLVCRESLILGWELMAVCLAFFPPSVKFQPYLEGFINRHKDTSFDAPDVSVT